MASDDFRRNNPRFTGENLQHNLNLVAKVKELADSIEVTPSQLALAWVMAQGEDVVPIPGTRRLEYLEQNIAAVDISLSSQLLAALNAAAPIGAAAGDRYPNMSTVNA